MIWPISLLTAPRIHTQLAPHQWADRGPTEPDNPLCYVVTVVCLRCEQRLTVVKSDRYALRGPERGGCAGRRFRGRYRYGDHADADNLRYIFDRYTTTDRRWATVQGMDGLRYRTLPVALLRPVLAGRAEAEKRRVGVRDAS